VLCAQCVGAASSGSSFGALRTIRILRPLRAVTRLSGMRTLLQTLVRSFPDLVDAVILSSFVVLFFGLLGMQLYMGAFRQQCVDSQGLVASVSEGLQLCSLTGDNAFGRCTENQVCGKDVGDNPNGNITSFDNLFQAMLVVFQSITLEGWVDVMYNVRKVRGLIHDIYFITLVLIGSLFMTNVVVAVVAGNFMAASQERNEAPLEDTSQRSHDMGDSSLSIDGSGRFNPRHLFSSQSPAEDIAEMCRVRRLCYVIATSQNFAYMIMVMITLNTLVLALDNVVTESILEPLNDVFSGIFVVEMIVKLVGLSPKVYVKDPLNVFDGTIVIIALLEIALSRVSEKGLSLTMFRTFRLLRIFKLSRSMQSIKKILDALLASLSMIIDLGWLLLLFIFVCALLGMTLYGCTTDSDVMRWSTYTSGQYEGQLVRPNFSSFLYSMTTVFITITGENWNDIMYIAIQNNNWFGAVYFVLIVVIGSYIILNLFLAILLDKFEQVGRERQRQDSTFSTDSCSDTGSNTVRKLVLRCSAFCGGFHDFMEMYQQEMTTSQTLQMGTGSQPTSSSKMMRIRSNTKSRLYVEEHGFRGRSLFLFSGRNSIRRFCWRVVRHRRFEMLIYFFIAVSSINLALDAPDVTNEDMKRAFYVTDVVLTFAFLLEAAMKIIVYGLVCNLYGYLHDGWNVLDFVVLVLSITDLILVEASVDNQHVPLSWVTALRALRALRPLRVISRNDGMKAVVNSVFKAIPSIMDVMFVLVFFLIIFGILGVQLFKNKLHRCSCFDRCPERRYNPASEVATGKSLATLCLGVCSYVLEGSNTTTNMTCAWEAHPDFSFDNIFLATLTLFEVATLELWPQIMFLAVDGTQDGEGPRYDSNPLAVLFFIVFLFVMSFFIMNLFVGIINDKFRVVQDEMHGVSVLSPTQLKWIATQRVLLGVKPWPLITPSARWRQLSLQLVSTRMFEYVILSMIVANVLVMCLSDSDASTGLKKFQDDASGVFLVVFAVEAAIKIFALRLLYFHNRWNCFDFTILVGSIFTTFADHLEFVQTSDYDFDATLLRSFRVARIFRLVNSLQSLQRLFITLVSSLPSLVNVGALLLLLSFVYAVSGMAWFGNIQIDGNVELRAMSQDANFASFYLSMVTLFRMSTGESWNAIMHDCFSGARCAAPPHNHECGSTVIAILFFVSFMLIGSFVFLNLFIAVIIEKWFESVQSPDRDSVSVTKADLESFVDAWGRLAPEGGLYIPTHKLPQLLRTVDPPLGFSGESMMRVSMIHLMLRLGFRDHGGRVHFTECLWRLASMVVGTDMQDVPDCEVLRILDKRVVEALPVPPPNNSLAAEVAAAVMVQSWWRTRKAKLAFLKLGEKLTEQARQAIQLSEESGAVKPAEDQQHVATSSSTASTRTQDHKRASEETTSSTRIA